MLQKQACAFRTNLMVQIAANASMTKLSGSRLIDVNTKDGVKVATTGVACNPILVLSINLVTRRLKDGKD